MIREVESLSKTEAYPERSLRVPSEELISTFVPFGFAQGAGKPSTLFSMDYWKFECTDFEDSGLMVAFLGQYPFDSFEESPMKVTAYLSGKEDVESIEVQLELLKASWNFHFEKVLIPHQNWNKKWEDNFTPILVDDFCCIRADFHELPRKVKHEIIINPKMAFGTGHHETTRLMIRAMKSLDFKDKTVFDFGFGTGILAFLSEKLGAKNIDAVEIEKPAYENAVENAELNSINHVTLYLGTLTDVPETEYDIILANINRNVILESIPALKMRVTNGGMMLLSGFLQQDIPKMKSHLEEARLKIIDQKVENNWVCLTVQNV